MSDEYQPAEVEAPPAAESDVPWPHIVLYGASWCRDTVRTRRFLNRHRIPYTLVDVETDPQAAQTVMDWNGGYLSTPTLDVDGDIVTEPSDEELARLLGLAE